MPAPAGRAVKGSRMASAAAPCYAPGMPAPDAVPPETMERLRRFADLLATWTRRINLVAPGDRHAIWQRHVVDGLRLLPLIPPGTARGIDLGSGGGVPGLVLAIASGVPFDLVESDRRKCVFLAEAARETGAPVRIHAARIEECGLEPASLVTARALAPLPALLDLAAPLTAPGGTMLFHKGARAEAEIEAARAAWGFDLVRHGPADSPVLAITRARATADA